MVILGGGQFRMSDAPLYGPVHPPPPRTTVGPEA